MEWLAANWLWVVLGLGAAWLFLNGGMGCGMGRHGSSHRSKSAELPQHGYTTGGHASEEGRWTEEARVRREAPTPGLLTWRR